VKGLGVKKLVNDDCVLRARNEMERRWVLN
jgi:hypothetical protein